MDTDTCTDTDTDTDTDRQTDTCTDRKQRKEEEDDLGIGQALQRCSSPQPVIGDPAQLSSRGVVVLSICW